MVKNRFSGLWLTFIGICTGLCLLAGCQNHEGSKEQLTTDVDSFATLYFNWRFPDALKYCTPESEQWIRYAASNVHQADVERLRNKGEDATVGIDDIQLGDDETTAVASITVRNFLQMDTIGQEAHLVEQASFQLSLEKDQGKWKIRMANLPRSGTRSLGSDADE